MMSNCPGFHMLKDRFHLHASHLRWAYYVADPVCQNMPERCEGRGILVGNAASPANEHLEVFKQLSELDLQDRQVFAPLSYGDEKYRQRVLNWGRQYLGNRFYPLLDFMPLDEYRQFLRRCDLAIFNNRRLQAFGNVILLLQQGSRIYLREGHTALLFSRELGLKVSSIEKDLKPDNPQALLPLSAEEKLNNIRIMEKCFGREAVIEMTRTIVSEIKRRRSPVEIGH